MTENNPSSTTLDTNKITKNFYISLGIIIIGIVLDQWTKFYFSKNFSLGEEYPIINGFFSFTFIKNTGVAFGIGANQSEWLRIPLFIILPCFACLWLAKLIWDNQKVFWPSALSYTLILSGAIGNIYDRIFRGEVVDFLLFYYKDWHYPAFNVADSLITIGAALIIIDALFYQKKSAQVNA